MQTKIEKLKGFSSLYDDTFFQMLRSYQHQLKKVDSKYSENPYSFFYPSIGNRFDEGKILFYEQSVPRPWNISFTVKQSIDRKIVQQAQEVARAVHAGEMDPSASGYIARNVINRIMCKDEHSEEWGRYCAWSSPMKISSTQNAGINQDEYTSQKDFAVKLFRRELEELEPSAVIFFSGLDIVDDFIGALGLEPNAGDMECIVVKAKFKNIKIIVTRKPEFSNGEKCVEEIIQSLCQL